MLEAEGTGVSVWRLVQGQGHILWPGQVPEKELWPAELAELESELEMQPESKLGAELPSVLSELALKVLWRWPLLV